MKTLFTTLFFLAISLSLLGQNKDLAYFYEQGIPQIENEWNTDDYCTSFNVLSELITSEKIAPPTEGSAAFQIFLKLADGSQYFKNDSANLGLRFQKAVELQSCISKLTMIYHKNLEVIDGKLNYGKPVLLLQSSILYAAEEITKLKEEFLAKNPDLSDTQKKGLDQMRNGLGKVLKGGLITLLDEYSFYDDEDICIFSKKYFMSYEFLKKHIETEIARELRKKLSKSRRSHQLKCVKKNIPK